jgi:16S rRNA (adenine1518-N6/adenine1519-N6)-dimethyltransferase
MDRAEVKITISQYGLHPSKKRGQNFLISDAIREKIVEAVGPSGNDLVLEIGPGLGSLTGRLIDLAGAVTAVEIDSGFHRFLQEKFGGRENFTLIHADFLKLKIMEGFTKIVSNLPYCCSTEILFTVARYIAPHAYVMLQKELAERLIAAPGHGAYGALSVTMGFYYEPEILFTVSREAFYPRPEVTSCFVRLARRNALALKGDDVDLFHVLVKSAFWGRRKTIRTALSKSPHLGIGRDHVERVLIAAGIDGVVRGEDLGLDEYISMVTAFRKIMG